MQASPGKRALGSSAAQKLQETGGLSKTSKLKRDPLAYPNLRWINRYKAGAACARWRWESRSFSQKRGEDSRGGGEEKRTLLSDQWKRDIALKRFVLEQEKFFNGKGTVQQI